MEIKNAIKFDFNDQSIQVVEHNGDRVLTDEQIGRALGYKDPAKQSSKLISRNIDELQGLYDFVKLTGSDGKQYNKRVWGERGVIKISLLARTSKAKDFRKWATEVLYQAKKNNTPVAPNLQSDAMAIISQCIQQLTTIQFETKNQVQTLSAKVEQLEKYQSVNYENLVNQAKQSHYIDRSQIGALNQKLKTWVSRIVTDSSKLDDDNNLKKWASYQHVYGELHKYTGCAPLGNYEKQQYDMAFPWLTGIHNQIKNELNGSKQLTILKGGL